MPITQEVGHKPCVSQVMLMLLVQGLHVRSGALASVHPREELGSLSSQCRLATTLVGGLVCRCPLRLCRWRQVVSMETVVFFTRDPTILKRC